MGVFELENIGFDINSALGFTGGEERLYSAMALFEKAYPQMCEKLKGFADEANNTDFSITVHAVKSNARMIGATALFKIAEQLELSTKEGFYESFNADLAKFFDLYKEAVDAIKPYAKSKGEEAPAELIGRGEAIEILHKLSASLDEYDDTESAKYLKKLDGFLFNDELRKVLDEAAKQLDEFMYDEALECVNKVIDAMGE